MEVTEIPQVIVLKPPPILRSFEDQFTTRFHLLIASNSELPLDDFLATYAQSASAILCAADGPQITADILRQLPSVRVIVSASTGVNHIDLSECRRLGILVANAGDMFSADCADYAIGLLIDVLRNMSAADRYIKKRPWADLVDFPLGSKEFELPLKGARTPVVHELIGIRYPFLRSKSKNKFSEYEPDMVANLSKRACGYLKFFDLELFLLGGKRVGIVGLGRIGLEVAKRLQAFGCSVSYNSRQKKDFDAYPFYANVCELAADVDVLIICCGLTEQTHHMIDRKVLLALGKERVIVNVGRRAIINEKEMVECLVRGEIGGAGLDVFENEPDVPKDLLN
ncbi:hypothetical protein FEM48_Zijuj12G0130100 [Ziziphus jujuba var. spinosa]|uniref:glyoxylate reductase (NADP(+)) n=1 Tax=Ziziphus jujuba var. spinosa TaxID=714518 RepID=A0A978UDH3_ZIZJJ|nr:hypothetical protein FEM48_Zijuj12G0130100 [Ziziphus jujuba var. spinosa]